ncbi:hypothetical protein [Variovorax sp. ZT4R33]|uniref:hypothetical protein n=1 Tax=Variovorax sp. ZT4R33 TaxID=3443743 RepID=UPI003F45AC14
MMNWLRPLALLPFACALAGCGTPSYEVVTYPNGTTRAPTSADAVGYCAQKGLTARIVGKAGAETGVLFRCL